MCMSFVLLFYECCVGAALSSVVRLVYECGMPVWSVWWVLVVVHWREGNNLGIEFKAKKCKQNFICLTKISEKEVKRFLFHFEMKMGYPVYEGSDPVKKSVSV